MVTSAASHELEELVEAGACAPLDPALAPGDVVLATELRGPLVVTRRPDPAILAGVLRRGGLRVALGPVVGVRQEPSDWRRRTLARAGVIAVDREPVRLAPTAAESARVLLRVVVDPSAPAPASAALVAATLGRVGALIEPWARALGPRELLLAAPRASCAGVVRAIDTVKQALEAYGAPLYVRRQIVHNAFVVAELEAAGAVFVEELEEVPAGATVVFSAHGVSPAVREQALARDLRVIDATCPLVAKVHNEARRFARAGLEIVLIGHTDHEEVAGTIGEAPERIRVIDSVEEAQALELEDPERVAYLTQTTLAVDETTTVVDALRDRLPALVGPASDDICYATQNRQDAVRAIAAEVDALLVVGSANSSNSRRLVEVAERAGVPALLVDDPSEVPPELLRGARRVGVTAGASAPEGLVQRLVSALHGLGGVTVAERETAREDVHFKLPALA